MKLTPLSATSTILVLLFALLPLGGCGCGFDCNSGDKGGPALLTLGLSDSLPEELKQVVLEIDSVTLRRTGAADVVIDRFTIDELRLTDADTFQIDLLDYPGTNQLVIIEGLELEADFYSQIILTVVDDGINHSYVQEADDKLKAITISGGTLSIPGRELFSGNQELTLEFGLALALEYLVVAETYQLGTTGLRLVNAATAASISGQVDSELFDTEPACSEKSEPTEGNRIYLYQGGGLSASSLADVFNRNSSTAIPGGAIAPYAVATLAKNTLTRKWDYAFGFLPAGEYTLAFACDTGEDDARDFDDLVVPQPADQIYTISLTASDLVTCNLTTDTACQ